MVGVPKSKGCQTCLRRRVKVRPRSGKIQPENIPLTLGSQCDMLRPGCTQCQRYGVHCPGYTRSRKFMDEGPNLEQRFGQTRSLERSNSITSSTSTTNTASIDERIVPSLVAQSMNNQQPVIFGSFVQRAFTRWFGLNKYRVHVPWTAYIAQNLGASPPFDAGIHCLNTMFMGHSHTDTRLQRSSRELYSKALRLFGDQIRNSTAMSSRESVGTTILLSLFEAYSQTNPDSWARHAGATAFLMAHRGPAAHLTGFDRCIYLSFRSFIVAEAFVNGKECIFERPEWQTHIDQVRAEDMSSPRVDGPIALIIDLQDRIFCEVSKIPGFLYRARRLQFASESQTARHSLAIQVRTCSQALSGLAARLRLAATVQGHQDSAENDGTKESNQEKSFIGPIASTFPRQFANSVLRGSYICRSLLRLLLDYLERDGRQANVWSEAVHSEASDPLPFRIVSKFARLHKGGSLTNTPTGEEPMPSADRWLDQVAASMGLEAFDIIICVDDNSMQATPGTTGWKTNLPVR